MIRFNGVNHLAMATGDMDTTIRYWRDLLGMRLVAGLGQPGYRHYFFQISDYDLIAFFEWSGVTPVMHKDHGFIHSIYSFDPNGIPVEFSHNVEGINIRQNPTMEDSAPSEVTREGAEPQPGKWAAVERPTPEAQRVVYPGAGSELFHGKR